LEISFLLIIFLLLLLSAILAISTGSASIPPGDVVNALLGNADTLTKTIVIDLRLGRVLLAIGTGLALGMSGCVVQSIFQNPLAEPYILGISAGSVLGVLLSLVFLSSFEHLKYSAQLFSFIFALLTIVLVYRIASVGGTINPATLLLGGIAISALFSAITSYLIYTTFSKNIATILFWTMGGFWQANLVSGILVFVVALISGICMLLFWRELNALSLGDHFAMNVGVDVSRARTVLIALVAFSVSFAVSFTGIIGFVGLVVPHIARSIVGGEHKKLLVYSGLVGALLLLWADILARTLIYGEELPVGIITALLGVPFFLYLLFRRRRLC